MRYLSIFVVLLLIFQNCRGKHKCCYNPWHGEVITFLDAAGDNLLNPSSDKKLEIESFKTEENKDVTFRLSSFSLDSLEEIWYMESRSPVIIDNCIDKDCNLLLKFEHQAQPDTLTLRIERRGTDDCTKFKTIKSLYNHEEITEINPDIGGYIIRK